ncbi:Phage major capsid protein [Rubellimicrobium mesophilum DSM 19309]|uniref:Phage major capsid protein n=1 Tax=Rubellimicrobium mesophilum DSM 19309 TaxID=442562 RepID=A0A017HCU4_9RHOB|nr:phage major capsid protein [Rubellimicrobium mesophilum]EYD71589.1 Phage major capsid protein [Rubellimicrobium mesophilum DSM 19309]
MLHQGPGAFGAIERKGEEETPDDVVTKAIADLTKTVDERLSAVEQKADTTKLVERLAKLEAKANRPGAGEQAKPDLDEVRKSFATYLRLGNATPAEDLKTLTVSSDPQGGYLAPTEMASEFIRNLVQFSPVRGIASVRSTAAPSVIYPTRTGITNAAWKGETQAQTASEPAFGQAEVVVREINTYVDISNQLLADSAGQAESEVRLALEEDFGQKEALAFISGDGVLAPEGILTNTGISSTTAASATVFTSDELITVMYALPAMYRNAGTWVMNGTTLATLRKLKDGQGNYLWQPSYQAGLPETLLGRPIVEMVDMPDVATGAVPIIFGDWSGYRIVDRVGLSVLVNPYIRATDGITRMHATRRVGGRVLQAAKFRKLKMA